MATCIVCEDQFVLRPDHRGRANVCLNCGGEDVEPLMARVSWEGKHSPIIEITTAYEAVRFNAKNSRIGCSVLASSLPADMSRTAPYTRVAGKDFEPKEQGEKDYDSKRGSGAERGAMYFSRLGEKHHLGR